MTAFVAQIAQGICVVLFILFVARRLHGGPGEIGLAVWNASLVTTSPALYVGSFIVVGASGVGLVTGLISSFQIETSDDQRGRGFGALDLAENSGQAVGIVIAGLLAPPLGLMAVLELQGALYLAAGAVAGPASGAGAGLWASSGDARPCAGQPGRGRRRTGLAGDGPA